MASLPSVQGVRVATPDDLHRISTVAAAAFFSSPTFQFQRPFHQAFPSDTIASYFVQYEAAIKDPLCVVLVAEDSLEADEARHVYEALRGAFSSQPPSQQGIVGVCSLQLKPDSSYIAHLHQTHKLDRPAANQHAVDDLRRDQSAEAVAVYNNVTRPAKLKHLDGNMRLNSLAVAPAYWRRGHAWKLVSFCTDLADLDDAVLGVSATPYGATVMSKAGFQEQDIIRYTPLTNGLQLQQGARNPAGFELWIGTRMPRGLVGTLKATISLGDQTISHQDVMRDQVDDKLIGTDCLLGPATDAKSTHVPFSHFTQMM